MRKISLLVAIVAATSCAPIKRSETSPSAQGAPAGVSEQSPAPARGARAGMDDAPRGSRTAPLFEGLGDHRHAITTKSENAQRYFDQGLRLSYAFNHAEAVRSFRAATSHDSKCAMCYWGIAFALGSNINAPMAPENVAEAWKAVEKARELAPAASEREQAYIAALAKRYQAAPIADRAPLDLAYANAMREVARRFPDDLDAATLYAESVMDTMPWNYYLENGDPKPEIAEAIKTLESVLARDENHIGAIHFYIHAVEASSTPERAEAPADRLTTLTPGAGHLVHMPSHIYYRVGRYDDAVAANQRAAAADESYITQCRAQGFYPAMYYPHNLHFLYAAASEEGRSATALDAAKRLMSAAPDASFKEYPQLEEFRPVYPLALVRFGKWDEVLAEQAPPSELRYATAMWHYARGTAFAAMDRLAEAEREYDSLRVVARDPALEKLMLLSGSNARDLLAIAERVLAAEVARVRGRSEDEVQSLREAVRVQDSLPYTEPPPWYFPVRHALGAALLRANLAHEAEEVFREDLDRNPRNGWSLFGLAMSLRAQGEQTAAASVEREFEQAWARADVSPAAFYE